jgi:hypothetical protein
LDGWRLVEKLGGSRTAEVWRASRDDHDHQVALKFLTERGKYNAGRFADEIRLHQELGRREGVLPLVRVSPDDAAIPWMAMEIAEPVARHLGDQPVLDEVIRAGLVYATTFAALSAS